MTSSDQKDESRERYIKVQLVEKPLYKRVEFYITLLIPLFSLYIAWQALTWQQERVERIERTDVVLDAAWTYTLLLSSKLEVEPGYGTLDSQRLYDGIWVGGVLRVSNNSWRPITVDDLRYWYLANDKRFGHEFHMRFSEDDSLKKECSFPVTISAKGQERFYCWMPCPVGEQVADLLKYLLKPDTIYNIHDVAVQVADLAKAERVKAALALGIDEVIGMVLLNTVPYMLVKEVRIGDRRLELEVRLTTGESFSETVDYVDLIKTTVSKW